MEVSQPPGPTPFAQRLRRAREQAGLTQRELAERIGVRQDVLSRVERGLYVGTDLTVVAMARVLGLDEQELLELAAAARDPVVAAVSKSDRLDDEAKRQLLDTYRELVGESVDEGQPLLLSVREAARRLSVSREYVARLVALGDLELVTVGPNSERVTARSVRALVERRAEETERRLGG